MIGATALIAGGLAPDPVRTVRPEAGLPERMLGLAPNGIGMDRDAALPRFLRSTRIPIDAVLMFEQFYQGDLPRAAMDAIVSRGRSGVLTVEPFTSRARASSDVAGILAGRYDWRIRAWAAAWSGRGPVRFAHEMNGGWYPWGRSIGSDTYLHLWRRVRRVWRSAEDDHGVPHAPWIWCANVRSASFEPYYPGDGECDLVALDGYAHRANGFLSAARLFGGAVQRLSRLANHRILIGETGVGADAPDRGAWIQNLFSFLESEPRIQGINWYERNLGPATDYRLEGDTDAIHAFRDAAASWRSLPVRALHST